ncbi:hypothetical protein ACB092_02G048700 [Castanea dentata]
MFSFSRRKLKHTRLKLHLPETAQGTRSPIRHTKKTSGSKSECAAPPTSVSDELNRQCSSSAAAPEISNCASGSLENWMVLSIAGEKPTPRFNHAATLIGNKMIVVGGESGNGLLDDVQVSWGKKVLLIGGKTDPSSDRVSVWAFDTETECWSLIEAKGDIPVARSGHTVVRASSVLLLFGGEDAKKRKLNDLHMFDLKSLTWLPLHYTGTGPSPRSNHVATLYDDKTLFLFGGASKSKTLNDLYSFDFETMVWSRIKIRGFHPSPRAGSCGVLCGTKWYIAGGGSRKKRHVETLVFDVLKVEWSVAVASLPSSITTNKGFSLVLVQHKEKDFLVAFGGSKKEPSNQVEVLLMEKSESSKGQRSTTGKGTGALLFEKRLSSTGLAAHLSNDSSQRSVDSVARQNLASAIEQHGSGRKSLSESIVDPNSVPGNVSLRKQFHNEEEFKMPVKMANGSEDDNSSLQATEQRMNRSNTVIQNSITGGKFNAEEASLYESDNAFTHNHRIGNVPVEFEDVVFPESDIKSGVFSTSSSVYQFYELNMANLIRKNGMLEGQLAAAVASREAAERNLSSVLKSRQEIEKKLTDTVKGMELLKEKLAGVELAQEDANSLSNIVHSDNIRLEHDVAFLKAVLDDTQKELHSTRGVLAGERARAFQLQVEVFHLKQRLQSMENRAPTPRKPFNV